MEILFQEKRGKELILMKLPCIAVLARIFDTYFLSSTVVVVEKINTVQSCD